MVQKFKMAALAGAFMMVAAPAFAQDMMNMNNLMGTGIDLDPFHILTPAPAPAAAPAPMMAKHHMGHHHMMMHHKKMMMHHKKKMMMHKKMEEKKM